MPIIDRLQATFDFVVAQNIYDILTPVKARGRSRSGERVDALKNIAGEGFEIGKARVKEPLDEVESFNRIPSDRAQIAVVFFIEEILGFSEVDLAKKETKREVKKTKSTATTPGANADEDVYAKYYFVAGDAKGMKYRLVVSHTFLRLEVRCYRPNKTKSLKMERPSYQMYWRPIRVYKNVDDKYVLAPYPEIKLKIDKTTGSAAVIEVPPEPIEVLNWENAIEIGKQNLISLASNLRDECVAILYSNKTPEQGLSEALIMRLFITYNSLLYSDLKRDILEFNITDTTLEPVATAKRSRGRPPKSVEAPPSPPEVQVALAPAPTGQTTNTAIPQGNQAQSAQPNQQSKKGRTTAKPNAQQAVQTPKQQPVQQAKSVKPNQPSKETQSSTQPNTQQAVQTPEQQPVQQENQSPTQAIVQQVVQRQNTSSPITGTNQSSTAVTPAKNPRDVATELERYLKNKMDSGTNIETKAIDFVEFAKNLASPSPPTKKHSFTSDSFKLNVTNKNPNNYFFRDVKGLVINPPTQLVTRDEALMVIYAKLFYKLRIYCLLSSIRDEYDKISSEYKNNIDTAAVDNNSLTTKYKASPVFKIDVNHSSLVSDCIFELTDGSYDKLLLKKNEIRSISNNLIDAKMPTIHKTSNGPFPSIWLFPKSKIEVLYNSNVSLQNHCNTCRVFITCAKLGFLNIWLSNNPDLSFDNIVGSNVKSHMGKFDVVMMFSVFLRSQDTRYTLKEVFFGPTASSSELKISIEFWITSLTMMITALKENINDMIGNYRDFGGTIKSFAKDPKFSYDNRIFSDLLVNTFDGDISENISPLEIIEILKIILPPQ